MKKRLKLKDVKLKDLHLEVNDNIQDVEESFDLGFNINFMIREDNEFDGLMIVIVSIFDKNYKEKKNPYFIRMSIQGNFDSSEIGTEIQSLQQECLEILLPYVRSYISNVAALAGVPGIVVPVGVFEDLIEKHKPTN